MSAYCEKKKGQIKNIRKKVAFKMFSGVVEKTPVDTGRARGNWQISIGSDNHSTVERDDKAPLGSSPQTGEEKKLEQVNGDETVYIVNNLPYIGKLEYGGYPKSSKSGKTVNGFSVQAPNGMVGLTMAEWNKYVKNAIDESKE